MVLVVLVAADVRVQAADGDGAGEGGRGLCLALGDTFEGLDAADGLRRFGPGDQLIDGDAVAPGELVEGAVGAQEVLEYPGVVVGVERS